MKLLLLMVSLVIAVSAAPQGVNTQDAEFVPSGTPRGSSSSSSDGGDIFPGSIDFHFIPISRGRIPQSDRSGFGPSILDILFGPGSTTDVDSTPSDSGFPSFFNGFFGGGSSFPSIFSRPSNPDGPSISGFPDIFDIPDIGDIPHGTDNSTHEVKVINGTRYEVNRTVSKGEDGSFTYTQIFISLNPDKDGSPAEGEVPEVVTEVALPQVPAETSVEPGVDSTLGEADPAINQVETEPFEDFS